MGVTDVSDGVARHGGADIGTASRGATIAAVLGDVLGMPPRPVQVDRPGAVPVAPVLPTGGPQRPPRLPGGTLSGVPGGEFLRGCQLDRWVAEDSSPEHGQSVACGTEIPVAPGAGLGTPVTATL